MKVVLVGPVYPYRGGIAHYTTMLARALARKHVTRVISFRSQYPRCLYPGVSDRDPSRSTEHVDAEHVLAPWAPASWLRAAGSARAFEPDLVIMQWWTTFWAPAFAGFALRLRVARVPTIYLVHNVLPHEPRIWDRWLARMALAPVCRFVTHSERERVRLSELLPERNVTVCPMPIFDMFAPSDMTADEARRRLGLPEGCAVVLFFGLIRPYKGLMHLIDALALATRRGAALSLVVAGEAWDDIDAYRERAEADGVAGRVWFHNRYIPNEELGLFFGAADVFVAPYVSGTQSAVLRTALAFGVPCVATEIIRDESLDGAMASGWLTYVPPANAEALANAIMAMIDHGRSPSPPPMPTWDELVGTIEQLVAARRAV